MSLPVRIRMHEHETPESFANRLSYANGFSSFKRFLSMTRLSLCDLKTGAPGSIDNLATLSGADPELLRRYASTTVSRQMNWQLGSAVFAKEARRGQRHRYCAECVMDDLETGWGRPISRPYVRASWNCRAVQTCTKHQRPLLETPFTERTANDFCRFVSSSIELIRNQASASAPLSTARLDRYIEGRIRRKSSECHLDQFEAFVVVDLCEHLGHFVEVQGVTALVTPSQLRDAGVREIGFEIARQGEQAMRDVVATVVSRKQPKGSERFLFGSLGRWLRSNRNRKEFSALVEMFQDAAERSLPFGPGEVCFVPVRHRHLHSVHSAEAEYGLLGKRIVELLKEEGLVTDDKRTHGRVYFDAAKAHPILLAASRTLTSQEARAELGISNIVLSQLLNSGLLPRVEGRTDGRIYSRIRRKDIDAFRRSIFAHVTICAARADVMSLASVCKATMLETSEVLTCLIDGRLHKVTAPAEHGHRIDALRFDRNEVFALFLEPRRVIGEVSGMKVLRQRDAAGYLRVKTATVPYLMKLGLLESHEVANPVNRRKQLVVSRNSLDEFRSEYVAVFELATQYDTHTNVILEAARKQGIEPIYDDCGTAVSRFFRRRDIKDVVLDVPKRSRRIRKTRPKPA